MLEREQTKYSDKESIFFKIHPITDAIIEELPNKLNVKRYEVENPNPPKLEVLTKRKFSNLSILETEIPLPQFPENIKKPKIFVLGSPENEAVSLGRLKVYESGHVSFQPARFHTGYAALKDMSYAMRQSLHIQEIKEKITEVKNPEEEVFVIHITREGPLIRYEGSIFNEYRLNIPYTSAHSQHVETENKPGNKNNPFGRMAKVCPINFEGLYPSKAKTIIICDNTASGMQHVAVLEKTIEHIENNNGKHNIENLLIVSPLLTLYGAANVSYSAAAYNIPCTFVCSAHLLGCLPPKRYYSPVLENENLSVSKETLKVNKYLLEDKNGKACSRCNWTASFSAPRAARIASDEELKLIGTSNMRVLYNSLKITPKFLSKQGINPWKFISYSTLDDARHSEKLDVLEKELNKYL